MKRGRGFIAGLCAVASVTVWTACNLFIDPGDLTTSGTAGGTTETEGTPEAGAPTAPAIDATIVDGCSATNCELLPAGFRLVALGSTDVGCPSGFAQPFDAVEQPSLDPGACTCGCNVTQQPSCALAGGNTITLLYGAAGSGACPSNGQDVPSGCSTGGFLGPFIAYERKYVAPSAALTGGACDVNATKDDSKLKTLRARVCQATVLPQCEGKTCAPDVAPFVACIAADGALACPAAWPQRHLVGASASFTCGTGCTCSVKGQCGTAGTLSYFATTNCSGAAGLTYPADGGCNPTGASNVSYGSHRFDPVPPVNVSCQSGGSSSPTTPTLAQATTICCK